MAEYAYWKTSRQIHIAPGDVQIYRLPTMMQGVFLLTSARVQLPPSGGGAGQPGQPGLPPQPGTTGATAARSSLGTVATAASTPVVFDPANPGPGSPGSSSPIVQPEDLVMDLFHGDQLVATAPNGLPLQNTPSDGDDTWRVRVQLAPGSPTEDYVFDINLNPFPSMFPILTRKIPLAFFQQGFDDNWNGRQYISIELKDNNFLIIFDPELASYYHLTNTDIVLASVPGLEIPNIRMSDAVLGIYSSAGAFGTIPGPLPYILLTASFTSADGKPMEGGFPEISFKINDFSISVSLFLTQVANRVGYYSEVTSDLDSKLFDCSGTVKDFVNDHINSALTDIQKFLDSYSFQVGGILTPWLLGAAFDVESVAYSPVNSQPVPADASQGDIVIRYVGQLPPPDSGVSVAQALEPTVLTITTQAVADGSVGQAYSQDFVAAGGSGALIWSVTGTLPPGTTFTAGKLTGTPTTAANYNIQVTVHDAQNKLAARSYGFAVNAPGLSITTINPLPIAVAGEPYAVALAASVPASATWSANGLPPGLAISARGVISGTPAGNGSVNTVPVHVLESNGASNFKSFTLTVLDALLNQDPLYAPRGDGDTLWKPPQTASPGGVIVHPPPATTPGDLSKVDHIVVVMMENRSFDHMLGYLSREGGRSDVEGLKWETGDHRTQYNYYGGRYYYPNLLTDTHVFYSEAVSPDHSHESVKGQMADGMMHFVSDYAKKKVGDDPAMLPLVMGYYGADQLPTYDMLARSFAICDHWFCSHVGPTWPNRFVTLTGDLNRDSYGEPEVDTPDYADFAPSEHTTLFDLLTQAGVSWQYFQQRASIIRAFTKYSFDLTNVLEFDDPVKGFAASVKNGLPSVTFVDPLFGDLPAGLNAPQDNDDAPPSDLKDGQRFIDGIVKTLFNPDLNKNVQKTMLIIVYDEHGGFYDHVDPPSNFAPLLGQNSGKLGPRVPAFVVSHWTPAGMVLKDTFDHTTIAATILRRFCSPHPPIMSPRVTAARDLRGAL